MNTHEIYLKSPIFLQNIALTIFGKFNDRRRYGSMYESIEKKIFLSLKNQEEIKKNQEHQLAIFFRNAENSIFWKKRFLEFEIDITSNTPYEEIKKLPILTKQEVRDNAAKIKVTSEKVKLYQNHTSGTTGSGLILWETAESEAIRWATWWRYRDLHGIKRGDWHGLFGGRTIISPETKLPPYYRINYSSKQILFSCYHLSRDTVASYIQGIETHKLDWLHGYPSFIAEIAYLAKSMGMAIKHKPRIITTGAENLSSIQKRVIFDFFGTTPIQHYGLAESVANFSQHLKQSYLTVDEDFSYVEFIDNGYGQKRIIGTNLSNPYFPLFRYDTGDLASGVNEDVFPRTVEHVDGRSEDIVTLPNGNRVGRLDHIFKDAVFIDEAQIHQLNKNSLMVKIIKNKLWNKESESFIKQEFTKRLGKEMNINFEYPLSLEKTKSGKLRFVISDLK